MPTLGKHLRLLVQLLNGSHRLNFNSTANLLHLLDDFLIQPTKEQCSKSLQLFLDLCDLLGIPMAPEKTFGPSTVLTFAGIELDTIRCESRLPENKLLKCQQLIASFLRRKKATLKELQSLIGVLNFASSVVSPGRSFLRRLIDLTIGLRSPHHFVRVSKEVEADLLIWQQFFKEFNGKSFFLHDQWENSVSQQLFTNAAGAFTSRPGFWSCIWIALVLWCMA